MSVYTLDLSAATCEQLMAALEELAENWTKEKNLAHEQAEGIIYHEIREKMRDLGCGDHEILDVDKNGRYSVQPVAP